MYIDASNALFNIQHDVVSYNMLIHMYAKQASSSDHSKFSFIHNAEQTFKEMKKNGKQPDIFTYNSLIGMYVNNGKPETALKMYLQMKEEKEKISPHHESFHITFKLLILAFTKLYQTADAELVFTDMKARIKSLPDQTVEELYKSMAMMYARSESKESLDRGVALYDEMKSKGIHIDVALYGVLLKSLCKFVYTNDLINQSPNPAFEKESLTEKVDTLKRKLDTYGEVNPMAIEAFTEMTERYNFIIAQRNDLADAKNSLLETIAEIETTATNRFMEAFEKVRENFIIVFRSLFTADDSCDLLLAEPNNPLECRIDITAKPKGKRPQSINQLSGGEKTLTATALLFSLYLLKPAPFCIFDEVDAPLDDVNVEKFNNIIKEFSKDSQFIIVTHNKGTMAAVDVVYGVSMIEQGVSRVLPVDFRSLK